MSNGWIKIYRKIQDCLIWSDKEPFDKRSAWIDLLLSANHSDQKSLFNGELIAIKRGQILTSIRMLSDKWRWSRFCGLCRMGQNQHHKSPWYSQGFRMDIWNCKRMEEQKFHVLWVLL